ncbi:MAG: leucine-rich repeat domain-containing protein, partial [Alphaproteobacteria bacterium]|nr:leucine-rich repeat domain-containing protein [Alphaproteobacteria bacterium]
MTIPTLILAAVLAMGLISGSRAEVTCDYNAETKKLTISGSGVFEQSTFNNCTGDYLDAGHMGFFLADIDIGPNITGLGDMVFSSLYNNGEFTTAIHFAENSKLTSIGNGAFSGATNLTAIAIPDSVTNIGDYAFSGASNLTAISIPEGATSIGNSAFYGLTNLSDITIPDSVTNIGDSAFQGVSGTIIVPDTITTLGFSAFGDMNNTNIVCKGSDESCQNLGGLFEMYAYRILDQGSSLFYGDFSDKFSAITEANSELCKGSYIFEGGTCHKRNETQCNSTTNYYYADGNCKFLPRTQSACTGSANIEWDSDNSKCINKKAITQVSESDCYANGQVYWDNACVYEYPFAKKRWTPAEAAQYLKDTDNEIIMTFKVNR